MRFGKTAAGPMTEIPEQIISQQTAHSLWTVAERARPLEHVVDALAVCLPTLLGDQATARKTALLLREGWGASIEDLADAVAQPSGSAERVMQRIHPTFF